MERDTLERRALAIGNVRGTMSDAAGILKLPEAARLWGGVWAERTSFVRWTYVASEPRGPFPRFFAAAPE